MLPRIHTSLYSQSDSLGQLNEQTGLRRAQEKWPTPAALPTSYLISSITGTLRNYKKSTQIKKITTLFSGAKTLSAIVATLFLSTALHANLVKTNSKPGSFENYGIDETCNPGAEYLASSGEFTYDYVQNTGKNPVVINLIAAWHHDNGPVSQEPFVRELVPDGTLEIYAYRKTTTWACSTASPTTLFATETIQSWYEVATVEPTLTSSQGWQKAGSADFNFDGYPDIVWVNYLTNKYAIALMKNTMKLDISPVFSSPGSNWRIKTVTDLCKHDNNREIVWKNQSTGTYKTILISRNLIQAGSKTSQQPPAKCTH